MEAKRSESRDSGLALPYHALGRRADSAAALARMEQEHPLEFTNIAIAHAFRGERDQAFEWLRKVIAERDISLVHRIKDEPLLAPLRSDPRYTELLREMNLAK
jgi:hypothetical protein